jgi:hypothetical protein
MWFTCVKRNEAGEFVFANGNIDQGPVFTELRGPFSYNVRRLLTTKYADRLGDPYLPGIVYRDEFERLQNAINTLDLSVIREYTK